MLFNSLRHICSQTRSPETELTTPALNPLAPEHIPKYVVTADGGDYLMIVMLVFTLALILGIGLLYLTLHALPEKLGHHTNHSQMQVIGILALLALFTHNNAFWVVALLVAAFRPPDFITPITSIAASLSRLSSFPEAPGKQTNPDAERSDHAGLGPDVSQQPETPDNPETREKTGES